MAKKESTGRACVVCGKLATPERMPFCSTRCADRDLGRWLDGTYRIPTDERPGEIESPWGGRTEEDDGA